MWTTLHELYPHSNKVVEGEFSTELRKEKELRASLEKQLEEVKRNGGKYHFLELDKIISNFLKGYT